MKVTRDGDVFEVRPLHDESRFWEHHFAVAWEAETKAVIDRSVRGGTFVDIGAWVGPVSLWAAKRGARVIAAEPDPAAYPHLFFNLKANCREAHTKRVAISDHDGTTILGTRTGWGDSMSSLTIDANALEVCCLTLESFLAPFDLSDLQLIKMDIEGGEGIVIPQCADYLRGLGAPLCLSLHPQWWPRDPLPWLSEWRAEMVAPLEMLLFPPR
jgi:FkbM family methyltransferase